MSSDEEVVRVRKKNIIIAGSSDEDEVAKLNEEKKHENDDSDHDGEVRTDVTDLRKKKRRVKTFDSSSESENDVSFPIGFKSIKQVESKRKIVPTSKTKENKYTLKKNIEDKSNIESSSEDEDHVVGEIDTNDQSSNLESKSLSKNLWYNNTDLYDAEGSSDEGERGGKEDNATSENEDIPNNESLISNSKKNRGKGSTKKEERKSKQKAKEDIKTDIHKESQRLLRQVPISIPYHRPKQRSLEDFLVRRKSTPKVPLQASSDQLVTALKEIEQREKEAELFYKSESSEDDSEIKNEEMGQEGKFSDETKTKDLLKADQILDFDVVNTTENKEINYLHVVELYDTKTPGIGERVCEESNNTMKDDPVLGKENAGQFENTDNEIEVDKQRDNVSFNPIDKFKILNDKSSNASSVTESEIIKAKLGNSKELTFESSDIYVEKLTNQENLNTNNFVLISNQSQNNINSNELSHPSQNYTESPHVLLNTEEFSLKLSESQPVNLNLSTEQSQININILSCSDKNSVDGHCNLVNTEEFSLKYSESYSENEFNENVSIKNPPENKNGEFIGDSFEDINIVKYSSVIKTVGVENEKYNVEKAKDDADLKESAKKEPSSEENNIDNEKEFLKKYNVELKHKTESIPRLVGSNNELIDLSEGIPKPEVNQLMQRFLTHLSYKKKPKKKKAVELSIVSAERDATGQVNAINEELVQVLVGEGEEEEDPSLARPGAKLVRLRTQLQQQMERQRDQEWAKKLQEQRLYEDEEVFEGEKDVCDGNEHEIEDYENKHEETVEEEEEEEEEESEFDEDETDEETVEKKKKTRSVFIDDEAEESDEEPFSKKSYKNTDDNIEDNEDDVECDESTVDIDINDKENNSKKPEEVSGKSPEKNGKGKGSKDICDFFLKKPSNMKRSLPRTRTSSDIFLSQEILKSSADEEELPSFQKPRSFEEDKEYVEEKLPQTPISPAFQLTALESIDMANRYNWSEPSTPCKDFLSPKIITPVRAIPELVEKSPQVCSQDLENMCSGSFTSQPLQDTEENTQDFELFLTEDSQSMRDQVTPVKSSSATREENSSGKNLQMSTLTMDEDDELAATVPTKKVKKLNFSDDEDEDTEIQETEDKEIGSNEEDEGSEEEREVDYDSEENEVIVPKAGEFLDVEAELSEEEWSSEDEDERGLDTLEMEEADKEKIDQRRLRRELGQIHMKEMLKEDKMQVKILQEMLLEDGELHSENKRQRLFRWSNNSAFSEGDNKAMLDSDEEKGEEDEDEENWRKSRHERELFLQEHNKKSGRLESLELEESDSQLLRLGQKALKRVNSSNSQEPKLTPPTLTNPLHSPDTKKPFVLPKRGSFLSRGQQALSRLAQMVSSTTDGPIQQPKNSRNFVFTSISPTKGEQEEAKPAIVSNKRKLPHLPLPIAKKSCVLKPKAANKKSLFEALTKVQS